MLKRKSGALLASKPLDDRSGNSSRAVWGGLWVGRKQWHTMCALALLLAGVWFVPQALARILVNTIDTTDTIGDNGKLITVTGPIVNDQAEWDDLRLTITQRTTGAVAEGRARISSTTSVQQWTVQCSTQGSATFTPGPAAAVALGTSTSQGKVTDAHQWLVNITLQ